MHKSLRRYGFRLIALGTSIIIFLLISVPDTVGAENVPAPPDMIRSGTLKIMEKGDDAIFVGERRFVVTEETVIWDLNGKAIDLFELFIPCTAEIKFKLRSYQDPLCLEIKVKSLY